jgi:hypothetical protein
MRRFKGQSNRSLQNLLHRLKRFFMPWIEPAEPEDPFAYRTAPVRRPPHGRGGAAVAELDEE